MSDPVKRMTVEAAIQDLQDHTLAGIAGAIAQLVYLASTRDYNTGQYHHDGLAFHFSEDVARTALESHHKKIFRELVFSSVEDMVRQLDEYVSTAGVSRADFLELWKTLEPYRVTVPVNCDPLAADLFFSNIKVALAILQNRQETNPGS